MVMQQVLPSMSFDQFGDYNGDQPIRKFFLYFRYGTRDMP
jgi:hypothetical protein